MVARKLGKPLMPWQQSVADVILEIDPATSQLWYQEFGLTVPRQSGKSTLVLAKSVHRGSATGFFGPRQKMVYTAQTRQKAREKWDEDYAPELEQSPVFRNRISVHRGPGNEHFRFANGSRFGIEANTEKAGHGGTLDEAYIDEAFAQVDYRLEQAFGPAMITRLNKQLAWISTAGWLDGSPYLTEKVSLGRTVVDDAASRIAYFEWSASEECDPGDEDVWWRCMPALGRTITPEAIRAEYNKALLAGKLNDFKRAYLNLWVPKESVATDALPLAAWAALADPDAPRGRNPVFGVATAPDRSWSAVGVAWRRPDGAVQVMLTDYRPDAVWVAEYVAGLRRKWGGRVLVDMASRDLVPGAEELSPGEQARAHNALSDAMTAGTVRHGNEAALNTAVKGAKWRLTGDTRVLDRKGSVDISPLAAVALAAFGVTVSVTKPGRFVVI